MKYNHLTFLRMAGTKTADGHKLAVWLCDCGNTSITALSRVKNGYTKSCGCEIAAASRANAKHGMHGTIEYSSWLAMRRRCMNSSDKDFKNYGARGISVCLAWMESFEQFFKDMGKRPAKHTIERIDVNGNYEPSNCRWATPKEQGRNKRNNVPIMFRGKRMFIADVAKELGISYGATWQRAKRGQLNDAA